MQAKVSNNKPMRQAETRRMVTINKQTKEVLVLEHEGEYNNKSRFIIDNINFYIYSQLDVNTNVNYLVYLISYWDLHFQGVQHLYLNCLHC